MYWSLAPPGVLCWSSSGMPLGAAPGGVEGSASGVPGYSPPPPPTPPPLVLLSARRNPGNVNALLVKFAPGPLPVAHRQRITMSDGSIPIDFFQATDPSEVNIVMQQTVETNGTIEFGVNDPRITTGEGAFVMAGSVTWEAP
jgi:hypothetical protein